ncbi:MAG: alkyl sulfatase dimerization domain-containing protein [Myxococcota bacterium]
MIALLIACQTPSSPPLPPPPKPTSGRELLEIVDGIHVAIGYGLANAILLEGPEGIVLVDAMESATAAREVREAFRSITDVPVSALILTHNHADHVFGGAVMAPGDVPVYAHKETEAEIDRVVNVTREILQVRSAAMFGSALPDHGALSIGDGPRLRFDPSNIALKRPTHTIDKPTQVELGGLSLELLPMPGETDDHLAIWLPDRRVLLPGDNIYEAFPNLYSIRGTPYRDVRVWIDSLDRMRDLQAALLVPSHTHPVVGADAVERTLTAYRDAIQYVHDQTVRHMNKGLTPDELAATIRLPPHLAQHPWLKETYGRVDWSVRAIYDGYLGWFDGDASMLRPLAPEERAERFANAFAQARPLSEEASAALERGDFAWAAEVAQLWRRSAPGERAADLALASAYEGLARDALNMNARRYLLTQTGVLRGEIRLAGTDRSAAPKDFVVGLSLAAFMRSMPTRLRAEDVLDVDERIAFEFPDVGERWVLHVRRGVAEMRQRPKSDRVDLRIIVDASTWKLVATGHISATAAWADGRIRTEGGLARIVRLLSWFG